MNEISIISILVATILSFALGMFWYSNTLFGRIWRREMKISEKEMKKNMEKDMKGIMAGGLLLDFITAFSLNLLLVLSAAGPLYIAFFAWLGFMLPITLGEIIWAGKSWKASLINAGYRLVSVMVMALVFLF